MADRCCVICGGSMDGKRPQALVCGGACRADRSRLGRILAGLTADGASSVAEVMERRIKRTAASRGSEGASSS